MLHSNIKFLRNSNKLSQEKWGELFGITRGMVDSYERNTATPNPATLAKIALHYEISMENLMHKDFQKNPALIFATPTSVNQSELLKGKDEMILYLKQQNEFLQKQIEELTKIAGNNQNREPK